MLRTNYAYPKNKSKSSKEFGKVFSNRLKKAREHAGITSAEKMSELIGIASRTYQNYESANENYVDKLPNIENISKICEICDCDFDYLIGKNPDNIFKKEYAESAEILGLSYEAYENIKKYEQDSKDLLSHLITYNPSNDGDIFHEFLIMLNNYGVEVNATSITINYPLELSSDGTTKQETKSSYESIDSIIRPKLQPYINLLLHSARDYNMEPVYNEFLNQSLERTKLNKKIRNKKRV